MSILELVEKIWAGPSDLEMGPSLWSIAKGSGVPELEYAASWRDYAMKLIAAHDALVSRRAREEALGEAVDICGGYAAGHLGVITHAVLEEMKSRIAALSANPESGNWLKEKK